MPAPALSTVRKDLAYGVRYGYAEPGWVKEFAGERLFELPKVAERAMSGADGGQPTNDQLAAAFTEVVRECVARLKQDQYRVLLEIVLCLNPTVGEGRWDLLGLEPGTRVDHDMAVNERRRIAGQLFRGGKRTVTWGCIRSQHEPKALDRLSVLLADEG